MSRLLTTTKLFNKKKGQAWSLDYAISLALFIASIIAAVSIIGPDLIHENYPLIKNEAEVFSEQLMSSGSPEFWNVNDVIRPGLLTDNKISSKKLVYLSELSLEKKYEYAIVLKELNKSIIPIGKECVLGSSSVIENKNIVSKNKMGAYYYSGDNQLLTMSNKLNLTIYTNFSSLINNMLSYDYLILEQPLLKVNPDDNLLEYKKSEALEEFVREGRDLFIIGDLGINIFNLDLSINDSNATVVYEDDFVNLTNNTEISFSGDSFTINNSGKRNYQTIAKINNQQDAIAKFNYGDGFIYYLGTINGNIANTSETLLEHFEQSINQSNSYEGVNCNNYSLPTTKNMVVVKRLAPYNGRIVELNLYMWKK